MYISQINAQDSYLVGFQKEVSGDNFTYHSPFSNSAPCLLSRANRHFAPIVWETQVIPVDYHKKDISLVWLYGIDVTPTPQTFDIYVNDLKIGSFQNPVTSDVEPLTMKGNYGAKLTFYTTTIDRYKDRMGFAVLTIPAKNIKPGKSIQIKVDAVNNDSPIWYMTFKVPLKEKIEVNQLNVVSKSNDKLFHTVRFEIIHLGKPATSLISLAGQQKEIKLIPGQNIVDFTLRAVTKPTEYTAEVKKGDQPVSYHKFWIKPVKKWTVHMVQHTHTDIGYTRSQAEILPEHLRFIDYALDYCDQTDDYPDDAKFRWTCEAAWTVREYLKGRPKSQINRLLKRIKEGRIEVTGMLFNYSEILDETSLAMQSQAISSFKKHGIEVQTAMQDDVNGIGWCMPDFFHDTGVKYLTMGQHGHRAQIPFDMPTSFWWESPSGKRLLAYRTEHYMHGNTLRLTTGNIDEFRTNLSDYLKGLEEKKYPFDHISFQFSGYITDNSPPSTIACDIVKEWNEKYEWPKLRLSLDSDFMSYMEENEASNLPVKRVAWPDWWTDGFGSAMNETKASRAVHAEMINNMGLFSMARMLGAKIPAQINKDIYDCYDNLLFYGEHTFGADESITNPLSENVIKQWGQKSSYVWSAVKQSSILKEKALGYLQPFIKKSSVPTIVVFNTLNWQRSGLVEVYIDHQILPLDKEFEIIDEKGNVIDAQLKTSRNDGSYWMLWVEDIPAMGYTTLRIVVDNSTTRSITTVHSLPQLENEYYSINIDRQKGAISSIYDKTLHRELVDQKSSIQLGALIYEEVDNRHDLERLTNANRDTVYVPLKKHLHYMKDIHISGVTEGEIWNSVKINGMLDKCSDQRGIEIEVRLYNNEKKIELLYRLYKLKVNTAEGLYVAFPFNPEFGHLLYEAQGGIVRPGYNQLEGTATDWNTIQSFAAVKNQNEQIVFCSKSTPLVQFGDINTGHFYYKYKPRHPHIYSWVLNNYWVTNFRASQEGEMRWNYVITSSKNNTNTFATRFGWQDRIPLSARVIPKGKHKKDFYSKSILSLDIPNVLLVAAKLSLDGNAVVLHLRETGGKKAILDIDHLIKETGAVHISEVNVLEEELKSMNNKIQIKPMETKFIRLMFE